MGGEGGRLVVKSYQLFQWQAVKRPSISMSQSVRSLDARSVAWPGEIRTQ